jgi:hypothetical protein
VSLPVSLVIYSMIIYLLESVGIYSGLILKVCVICRQRLMLRSWCGCHGMLVPKASKAASPFNSLRSFYLCSSLCILRTHIGIEAPSPSQLRYAPATPQGKRNRLGIYASVSFIT